MLKEKSAVLLAAAFCAAFASASPMKFLSFNVWGDYFKNPVNEREAAIESTIRKYSPDVVALQEMTPAWWECPMLGNLSSEYGVVRGDEEDASKYTGGTSKGGASDCGPEFVAEIRRVMEEGGVKWQMAELGRMEKGGGGTISQYMARFGMKVLDMGTPLLNMHAPWELASKFDCWQTYRAYSAYLRSK